MATTRLHNSEDGDTVNREKNPLPPETRSRIRNFDKNFKLLRVCFERSLTATIVFLLLQGFSPFGLLGNLSRLVSKRLRREVFEVHAPNRTDMLTSMDKDIDELSDEIEKAQQSLISEFQEILGFPKDDGK